MNKDFVFLATFTYPHEAVFLQTELKLAGITTFVENRFPVIGNSFYEKPVMTRSIFIRSQDATDALKILKKIRPDLHSCNRCNIFHSDKLEKLSAPQNAEQKICWSCYGVMISALVASIISILRSVQYIF